MFGVAKECPIMNSLRFFGLTEKRKMPLARTHSILRDERVKLKTPKKKTYINHFQENHVRSSGCNAIKKRRE
jgi:hypothetical protein